MIVRSLSALSSQLSAAAPEAGAADAFLERAPLLLRNAIVQLFPESLQWLVHHVLTISVVLTFFGLFFAFTTIAERKLLARLQNRLGPNRTGLPFFRRLTLWA